MFTFVTTSVVVAFVAGAVVGWNLLPQPQWVKDLINKIFGSGFR